MKVNWKYVLMYFVLFFALQAIGLIDFPFFDTLVETMFDNCPENSTLVHYEDGSEACR